MLWFFEKHQSRLRYEIRRHADGDRCELVLTHPDGREEIEVYADTRAILQRARDLQTHLMAAGWRPPARSQRPGSRSR